MVIASVFNNKGGVAKTTCTQLFGEAMATIGYPALLIDADSQGSLAVDTYDIPNDAKGLADMIQDPADLMSCIHPTRVQDLWIMPPGKNLEEVTKAWEARGLLQKRIREIIDTIREGELKESFDICFVDNPPRSAGISLYVSEYADKLLIPVQSENSAFRGTLRTYTRIKTDFEDWENQDVSILITQHNGKRATAKGFVKGFHDWTVAEHKNYEAFNNGKKLKLKVLANPIPDTFVIENSKLDKSNIFLTHASSDASNAYIDALQEFLPEIENVRGLWEAVVKKRKEEHFRRNILPNAFKKKEEAELVEAGAKNAEEK